MEKTYRARMLVIFRFMCRSKLVDTGADEVLIIFPGSNGELRIGPGDEEKCRQMYETKYKDLWESFITSAKAVVRVLWKPIEIEFELVYKHGWKQETDPEDRDIIRLIPPEFLMWDEEIKLDLRNWPQPDDDEELVDDPYNCLWGAVLTIYQGPLYRWSGDEQYSYKSLETALIMEENGVTDMDSEIWPRATAW